ncbi:hypothetical protein CBR_g12798 [Chara braunii]|uniref:PDZ domain-containing protein n=1 Tax=Chara braunii TaxID=69332 RepID=A0A388KSU8_CHABU|nr:hypothetical protein CBR_g12798 [Chara braunii]|eukprot:GBG73082.1 hypothetical protein CBR_g12798 [Chara braunii]
MNALRSACAPAAGVRFAPAIAVRRVLASGSPYCCHCSTPPKGSSSHPLRRATPYVQFTGLRRYAEVVYKRKAGNDSRSRGVSVDYHPRASAVDDGVAAGVFLGERKGGRKFHGVCRGLKGDHERRGQDLSAREANHSHSTLWAFSEDSGNEEVTDAPFMDAVVKVYCTYTEPNFSLPWQKKRQYSSTGSGFMCAGRRVLTNAHCVQHHTQVKLKRRGDDTKFVAQVLAIGHECDIALLSVEDEGFWKGVEPLKFGSLPRLQDAVVVVGYPIGGDTISVTSGVVSRIEVTSYTHGSSELLGVQIDAAINPGFPILGVQWQRLENPALRNSLGMSANMKGVMVRRIEPTSYAFNILQVNDVIMSFDGTPVANDGTVPFRTGERISFGFLVSQKFSGESAELCVLRDGKQSTVTVPLRVPTHGLGRVAWLSQNSLFPLLRMQNK